MTQPQPATAESELRLMLGDLLMQIAMLRAENANLKATLSEEQRRELAANLNGSQPTAPPVQ
jgi:hypothetical protein